MLSGKSSRSVTRTSREKQVVFVLGPSGAGKTSSVATVSREFLTFPSFTFDGDAWRKASKVWKCHAQNPNGVLLEDYYGIVKKIIKRAYKEIFKRWVSQYSPSTILVPDTAVPCVSALGTIPSFMSCKFLRKIPRFQGLGYTKFRFVVVHASFDPVLASGLKRAKTEGKYYDPCTYGLAMASVFNLYHYYKESDGYEWHFVTNTFVKDEAPQSMTWDEYKDVAHDAFDDFQKKVQALGLGCSQTYLWLANHTL